MNKHSIEGKTHFNNSKYVLKIMKTTVFLLLFSILISQATNSYSQGAKITLNLKSTSIKEVCKQIEKNSDYIFVFSDNSENIIDKKVDIDANLKNVTEILDTVLSSIGLMYKILDKQIVVYKSTESPVAKADEKTSVNIAQQRNKKQITGKVVDTNGEPVIGANIIEIGTTNGSITDNNGNFSLNVDNSSFIQISFIGYLALTVNTDGRTVFNIVLLEDTHALDEIVVTGYTTQSKREITGSISTIRSEQVSASMTTSIDGAMQGRMPGVNVQSSIGIPGADIQVRVRGVGSITAGNDPIYVLDGVILNTTATSHSVSTNPLSNINPDDIISIEVLKDAAAASVYGAQAANGVILVTTKKGRSGRAKVTFSFQRGYVSPIRLMNVLSTQEYLNARFEAVRNYNPSWTEEQVRKNVLEASQLSINLSDNEIAELPTYDWQKASYRTGVSNKYNLSIDGGSDKSQYRVSMGYENTEGAIIASKFKRNTINFNYSNRLSDKIDLISIVNLSNVNQEGPLGSLRPNSMFSAPSYASPQILPFIPIYLENGELNVDYAGFPGTYKRNIIHSALYNENADRNNSILTNLKLNYRILENLSYNLLLGLDYRYGLSRIYYDPRTSDGYNSKGSLSEYTERPKAFTNSHVITYNPKLKGGHYLKTLIGAEYHSYTRESNYVRGEGFPTYEFRQMESAALITHATGSWTGFKRVGGFIQSNYTFERRFMISGILRYDGSSRFGKNNRFGFFPAISAGWDLAQENFVKDAKWISQLKLRAGYGETGNDQIGDFVSRSLYKGGFSYNAESGIRTNSLGNPNLKWERNATTNIGLDYSLFNHKFFGTLEVYSRLSKDLLLGKPTVWAGGFEQVVENLGEVVNKGVEIELGTRFLTSHNFQWKGNLNMTFQQNKVTKLYGDLLVLPGDESVRVGYSLMTHVMIQYAGVNPATGKAMWYDSSGNLTYGPSVMTGNSYAPHGFPNGMPKSFGGISNSVTYKRLTLDMFLQYDYGRVLYNNMGRTYGRKGDTQINTLQWYYDNRWIAPGQMTTVPRPINNAAERGSSRGDLESTRYLEDASYIRLKNMSLSYEFSPDLLKFIGLESGSLKLQANNLYTWTKFTGYDPEFNDRNTGLVPLMKSFLIEIKIGF